MSSLAGSGSNEDITLLNTTGEEPAAVSSGDVSGGDTAVSSGDVSDGNAASLGGSTATLPATADLSGILYNQELILEELEAQTVAYTEYTEITQQGLVMESMFLGLIVGMLLAIGLWTGKK